MSIPEVNNIDEERTKLVKLVNLPKTSEQPQSKAEGNAQCILLAAGLPDVKELPERTVHHVQSLFRISFFASKHHGKFRWCQRSITKSTCALLWRRDECVCPTSRGKQIALLASQSRTHLRSPSVRSMQMGFPNALVDGALAPLYTFGRNKSSAKQAPLL